MNTELRKNRKNDSKKDFFKLMNNSIFRKTIENLRKHRDINLSTTKTRRNYLVSELDHYTTNISDSLVAIEIKRKRIFMNIELYL